MPTLLKVNLVFVFFTLSICFADQKKQRRPVVDQFSWNFLNLFREKANNVPNYVVAIESNNYIN